MIVRLRPIVENFADLYERLGRVPLDRICIDPPPGMAQEADVLAYLEGPIKRLYELVDGTLVEKPMGSMESFLGGYIYRKLDEYCEIHDLGVALPGDGPVRLEEGNIRYPDVSFISFDDLPEGLLDEEIWSVTPALAIEVLSRSNTKREILRKLVDLFSTGCRIAWIIDPIRENARIYTSATSSRLITGRQVLDGGEVVSGFRLPLNEVFDHYKRRMKRKNTNHKGVHRCPNTLSASA